MEQEMNNIPNDKPMDAPQAPEQVVAEQVTVTEVDSAPVTPEAPKKKSNSGMILGLILCLLLAIAGVGFGIWAMMDGNAQRDSLNAQRDSLNQQISDLQNQNIELSNQVADLKEQLENKNNETVDSDEAVAEIVDGNFYVVDAEGNIIMQSEGIEVKEIKACEWSADNTVMICDVDTSEGEGQFLYDVFGDSLGSSFDE